MIEIKTNQNHSHANKANEHKGFKKLGLPVAKDLIFDPSRTFSEFTIEDD